MTDLEKLEKKIDALSPSDALRCAAVLLDAGEVRLAHQIVDRVLVELGARVILQDLDARKVAP